MLDDHDTRDGTPYDAMIAAREGRSGETNLVQSALLALSSAGCFVWRNNTGKLSGHGGRMVSFGIKGSGDIIGVLPDGRFLSAEAKVNRNKPTDAQYRFAAAVGKRGGVAVWFRTVPELLAALGLAS